MENFEKLGAFYLGKLFDQDEGTCTEKLLLYDAKDLTTHAVCVGMTGSGKTGLCLTLLEEAAIDGIPALLIDPKGDLGNLLLTFPELRAEDFRPWIDDAEATRKGLTADQFAANRAELWRKGLAEWGQDGSRIARFRDAADIAIYTPGSNAGLPLTVLRSFDAPPRSLVEDSDAFRERVSASVSGLLALLGIDADPIRSREHILLATILDRAWREGQSLDIARLIQLIQSPSFERIGVMDLESFFPARDRFELAMTLNNLLASPGFAGWMEGESLDVGRLLYTAEGRPRLSILSIAHLTDAERMFFVTILLNEVVAWMRNQPGTSSLRALLYMDEVFGFFPPVANPPSKTPMLTLLKQARAYGLGVVLATQNPVDLDYKGLSNAGTWFLGRLQTERDKERVLDGLAGATAAAGTTFDRKKTETILSGLGSRVFLMNNVHEDEPVLFQTRWALSYLRGPLTRSQIQTLMASRRAGAASMVASEPLAPTRLRESMPEAAVASSLETIPPPLPPGITQSFLPLSVGESTGAALVYRPALLGVARMHYVRTSAKVDFWEDVRLLSRLDSSSVLSPWESSDDVRIDTAGVLPSGDPRGRFTSVPGAAAQESSYSKWTKELVDHLYRTKALSVWKCSEFKQYSKAGEDQKHFRIRLRQEAHERRDLEVEKLRQRYGPKLASIQDRVRRARQKVELEEAQFKQSGFQTAVSLGSTLLGALFGARRPVSEPSVERRRPCAERDGPVESGAMWCEHRRFLLLNRRSFRLLKRSSSRPSTARKRLPTSTRSSSKRSSSLRARATCRCRPSVWSGCPSGSPETALPNRRSSWATHGKARSSLTARWRSPRRGFLSSWERTARPRPPRGRAR